MLGYRPLHKLLSAGFVALVITGCSTERQASVDPDLPHYLQLGRDARGNIVTNYKVGNPYEVAGKWYYPAEDYGYNEVGLASWYGPGFHGKRTANGEQYDMNALTAAHKTLPMSSVVLVTNLENGRSMKLRINDRGPFVDDRIIDLSRRAAQMLDVERPGVARVRVELIPEDSLTLKNMALAAAGQLPASEMPGVTAAPRAPVAVVNLAPPSVPSAMTPPAPGVSAPVTGGGVASPTITSSSLPPPAASAKPSTIAAAVPSGQMSPGLYVQAGAFTDVNNARRLEAQLSGLGNVFVAASEISGRMFHRVRIGPMPDRVVAEQVLADMIGQGYDGARIVEE